MSTALLTDFDFHLFNEGSHFRTWEKLGAHRIEVQGVAGTHFAVWAPNARDVSVIGDFNGWKSGKDALRPQGSTGIWTGFIPGVGEGALYKYAISPNRRGRLLEKIDPYAFAFEKRPKTASKVWSLSGYSWNDADWLRHRAARQALSAPQSVYELHAASWMRVPEENNRWLTYRELAPKLVDYVRHMGFTHVELLPIMEHPLDASWGYQVVGYFAPTSRFGTPQDFMHLVDTLHQNGIGVILDWVPAHFPRDSHGLAEFDGTALYEHEDPRKGAHKDWGTLIFNYGRWEVSNFLINNALFWLDQYHIDGLRVDAVASMLYLDYSRKEGEWIPNEHGGRENLEALRFIRRLNERAYGEHPGILMIAEESTAWPMVSRPVYLGGLGFGLKWDMGWMHDSLAYLSRDPIHRKHHHNQLTFRMIYAFTENYALPLSHDEVVHGKGSLLSKMPGDAWQRFANLRLLLGYQFLQPGKKLLFMGGEIAQQREWDHAGSVDWHLLKESAHQGIQRWVRDLNTFYRAEAAAHEQDCDASGFEWIDCNDAANSVIAFLRKGSRPTDQLVVVMNATPMVRRNYRVGAPLAGWWQEALNSDAAIYGGSGQGNLGGASTTPVWWHGRPVSLNITLPPLGIVVFRYRPEGRPDSALEARFESISATKPRSAARRARPRKRRP